MRDMRPGDRPAEREDVRTPVAGQVDDRLSDTLIPPKTTIVFPCSAARWSASERVGGGCWLSSRNSRSARNTSIGSVTFKLRSSRRTTAMGTSGQ
jgi:hypothetical protein